MQNNIAGLVVSDVKKNVGSVSLESKHSNQPA
jgi:hypothetical protein